MLILFDHGTPRGIASYLPEHTVKEARAQGWNRLTNGELLKAAENSPPDYGRSSPSLFGALGAVLFNQVGDANNASRQIAF